MRAGQFNEAKEQLASLSPTVPVAIERMRVCLRLGQFEEVLELLRIVLENKTATKTEQQLAGAMSLCARLFAPKARVVFR
jgi:hypothetical protein